MALFYLDHLLSPPIGRSVLFLGCTEKKLDILSIFDIVHTMNSTDETSRNHASGNQIDQFQGLITKLFQCCQERLQYQCERFELPDAELRCLSLFGEERYLTSKGIALKMNLVKSRISKIVSGLVKKKLIQRIPDPEDSRVTLLSLTHAGQNKLNDINDFLNDMHMEVLQQMEPEQRKTMITNLELLKASMESVKELMV
jgi:DNA-binding MarR family transcriptional regulator